jgi:E3 ubiquitin-protein ligase CHFR
MPFRAIQPVIDSLLRSAPYKARTEREKQQADEIYKFGRSISVSTFIPQLRPCRSSKKLLMSFRQFPAPREASPPPEMERSADYVHPCPHCAANNPYDWRCPQPIVDPVTDPDNAWHVDDGIPPGHAHCGNCENLLAIRAPTTSRCDFCHVAFCGIGVQDRCIALPVMSQQPHNFAEIEDLVQTPDIYDNLEGNHAEVLIMLEYVETQKLTPRHIYRDIVQHILKSPRGFRPLIEDELFSDLHAVAPLPEGSTPESSRNRICRLCAAEIFLWGLKDWWIRERRKGFLEESIMNRKDCPEGRYCPRQKDDTAHAREFNHLIAPPAPQTTEGASGSQQPPPAPEVSPSGQPPRSPAVPLPSAMPVSPARLAPSSSATSLSFLLNSDDIASQSSPPHRLSTPDIRDAIDMAL